MTKGATAKEGNAKANAEEGGVIHATTSEVTSFTTRHRRLPTVSHVLQYPPCVGPP
jgi:hypothetical protein